MQIQNTHFKIYAANTKQQNAIYIKTNAKNNLTYMCSSIEKVILCLKAHNLKNATVSIAESYVTQQQRNLAQATYTLIANSNKSLQKFKNNMRIKMLTMQDFAQNKHLHC